MIELIKATRANGVVFISGDVHWGEISVREVEGGYPLHDVTASALNQTWPTIEPNQFRVGEPERGHNFGMIVIDWKQEDPVLALQLRNAEGEVSVEKTVKLSELRFAEGE
jgi:alkaline phosphatase D